jgi:hypothetical protein
MAGGAQLLEVVGTRHPVGGFANLLNGGHEKADEHGDDGDDHEQFNQCEPEGVGPLESAGKGVHGDLNQKEQRDFGRYAISTCNPRVNDNENVGEPVAASRESAAIFIPLPIGFGVDTGC